jgi:hypothetical protein
MRSLLAVLIVILFASFANAQHYSYTGDIWSHLTAEHGQSSYYVAGLTQEQAEQSHDALHQQSRGRNVVAVQVTSLTRRLLRSQPVLRIASLPAKVLRAQPVRAVARRIFCR